MSIACLTIYDMLKAVDRAMRIEGIAAPAQKRRQIRRFFPRGGVAGMSGDGLLSVAQARARILASVSKDRPVETVALERASGRTLAKNLAAKRTQPPKAMSAMDGYAVRAEDLAQLPVKLKQIGESTAGHGFPGSIGPKETRADFHRRAGASVGCDTILVQEKAPGGGRVRRAFEGGGARPQHSRQRESISPRAKFCLPPERGSALPTLRLAAAMNFAKVAGHQAPARCHSRDRR